jgi:hypothetical protein
MEITSLVASIAVGDTIIVNIEDRDPIKIIVSGNGDIMICNPEEERKFELRKTKFGGWTLKEVELL